MSNPPGRSERAERICLVAAFWLPLSVCTYLALTPSPPQAALHVTDVTLHTLAFTYLTFAMGLAHPATRRWRLVGWMLAYGLMLEVLQSFEPARSAEFKDLAVDAGGIMLGLLLLRLAADWSRRTLRQVIRLVRA
jgi:VanZ family protein